MKKLLILAAVLVLIFSAVSCSASQSAQSSGGNPPGNGALSPSYAPATTATTTIAKVISANSNDITSRLVVSNGSMQIMVDDIKTAIDRITHLAQQKNGFVVNSQIAPSGEGVKGSITIRVPAEQFESTMAAIAALAVQVNSQSTTSKDVTQDYIDLNSRLTNLEATKQQYLNILSKAETVTDILNVQKQLSDTEGQIETTKGQIQYLEQTSATSLISVDLQQSKLIAKISVSRTIANLDEGIAFSPDTSGGFTPLNYQWDFGDKSTSTEMSPRHSFSSTGTFDVTLTVIDGKGDTATDKTIISIGGGWSGGNVARAAWHALTTFGKVIINIIIWLGIFSPLWIIGGGLAIFFTRRGRKKQAK